MITLPYYHCKHHNCLINNKNQIDIIIALSNHALFLEKECLVCQLGWCPTPSLLEELVEFVRTMRRYRS